MIELTLIVRYVGLATISFFLQVLANNTRFVDVLFTGLAPTVGAAVATVMNVGKEARSRRQTLPRHSTSSFSNDGD